MKEKYYPENSEEEVVSNMDNTSGNESPPVTEEEIAEAVGVLAYGDPTELKIEEIKRRLTAATTSDINTKDERTHDKPEESNSGERPFYFHKTEYERAHGSEAKIMRKAFGGSIWSFLINMFNPKAWKRYHKMMDEYEDDSLAKKTHTKELGGHYRPNVKNDNQ